MDLGLSLNPRESHFVILILIIFANTFLSNKVTFTVYRVRTWTYLFGGRCSPHCRQCPLTCEAACPGHLWFRPVPQWQSSAFPWSPGAGAEGTSVELWPSKSPFLLACCPYPWLALPDIALCPSQLRLRHKQEGKHEYMLSKKTALITGPTRPQRKLQTDSAECRVEG